MQPETKKDILKLAISKYGSEAQKTMAIEECSELINVLAKECRGRVSDEDIITEIADVMIMCEQLALIYGENAVESEKEYKLTRLAKRMGVL